ncbi:MAG: hypothetical protein JRI34_03460 [Deltaproteobacteria bacterium]|nr:hypothetical protein [Deltaproteobacteria bacterium]
MKRFTGVSVFILVLLISFSIAAGGGVPTLLQQKPGPNQEVKVVTGRTTVLSTMTHQVAISPKSIMLRPGETLKFDLAFYNPSDAPLEISMEKVQASSGKKKLKLLTEKELVEEIKQQYSTSKMKISKAQEKALEPLIASKISMLQEEFLKQQTIQPQGKGMGVVALKFPSGQKELIIEITASKDRHRFTFELTALQ